jgi:DNA-directed RNA polymerase subunit RPC12/RpoP
MKTALSAITVVALMLIFGCATQSETTMHPSGIDFDFGLYECPNCSHSFFYSYEDYAEARVKCPACKTAIHFHPDSGQLEMRDGSSGEAEVADQRNQTN